MVYCSVCSEELSRTSTDVPALGHNWGEPDCEWSGDNASVTARAVCSRNGEHILTETAKSAYAVTLEPTTEAEGQGTYTAAFTDPVLGTAVKTVPIPRIPTYTVSFLPGSGTGSMEAVVTAAGDYLLPKCSFTAPESSVFRAWSIGSEEYQPGESITLNADTEILALWQKPAAPGLSAAPAEGGLSFTAENYPEGARVVAARYDGGRLTDLRIVSPDAGTLAMKGSGTEYKLFLTDSGFRPLCPAWEG